jgi:hypothetical protein
MSPTPVENTAHQIDVYWGVREGKVMCRDDPYGVWFTVINRGDSPEGVNLTINSQYSQGLWMQDGVANKLSTGRNGLDPDEEWSRFIPCVDQSNLYMENGTLMGWEGSVVESNVINLNVSSYCEDEGILTIFGPIVTGD